MAMPHTQESSNTLKILASRSPLKACGDKLRGNDG